MIPLPEIFLQQMQALLQPDEFRAFCNSYNNPTVRGLRFNKLKISTQNVEKFKLPITYKVPWCAEGYTYPATERPAKNLFHHAGLFYIQEPSAMCPVEVLAPKPGHKVLDLCAAPGGKSAQIAGHLQGEGLLLSNDASPTRSRALVKNLERMGVTNAVVTTELPKKLADRFPSFFDRILVDAPCSGEGMFRRDPDAIKAYTANKPDACMAMQTEILCYAAKMLKPGGRLVYSTCTFNTMENECVIAGFLEGNKDFTPLEINHKELGVIHGFDNLPQSARIFPHLTNGEGHFIVLLEKAPSTLLADESISELKHRKSTTSTHSPVPREFTEFCNSFITGLTFPAEGIVAHGVNLYLQPEPLDLRGIRVARSGWHLGECSKGRFTPAHALAMGLRKDNVHYFAELCEENARRYLYGESLDADDILQVSPKSKPWVMVCYQGFPLGWARLVQGRMKNSLPVGLVVK